MHCCSEELSLVCLADKVWGLGLGFPGNICSSGTPLVEIIIKMAHEE